MLGEVESGEAIVVYTGKYEVVIEDMHGVIAGGEQVNLLDAVRGVVGILIRSTYCVGCGSCVNWCPTKALDMKGRKVVFDESKCVRCGICNKVCPLVQYLVRSGLRIK